MDVPETASALAVEGCLFPAQPIPQGQQFSWQVSSARLKPCPFKTKSSHILKCDCPNPRRARIEDFANPCYTMFALSDLAVSGGLPFRQASLPCTDFPKPLQRDHITAVLQLLYTESTMSSGFFLK